MPTHPFLLYGMEAVNLSSRELNTLNYTYSNAICKIFKVSHCSVEYILRYTQEPSIKDCWMSRKTRLVQRDATRPKTVNNIVVNLVSELSTVHTHYWVLKKSGHCCILNCNIGTVMAFL